MKYNADLEKLCADYAFDGLKESVAAFRAGNPGRKVVDLGVGDVCLPLPRVVGEAMAKASLELCEKKTFRGYPPAGGYSFLKQKIVGRYAAEGIALSEDEIFVSDGTKSDVTRVCELFGRANVLIPTPCYPATRDVNYAAGNAVAELPCVKEDDFLPFPPYGKKYDVVWLCSPNNPTGSALSFEGLRRWIDYALSVGALVVYDGAYADFGDGRTPRSVYRDARALRCAVELRSFSKGAGFTGVRCGYAVVPRAAGEYNRLMKRNGGCRFNGVSYVTQRGAEAALSDEGRKINEKNVKFYKTNAEILKNAFKNKNLWYNINDGSPYVFAEVPKGFSSADFCARLLRETGVVATAGSNFGKAGEGFFRLSAFCSREDAFWASEAVGNFLETL